MKLKDIRRDGFYTDGIDIYYKSKSDFYGTYTMKFAKTSDGIIKGYCNNDVDVERVNTGSFYDGNLIVIDNKTIQLLSTTFTYYEKEFNCEADAEAYASSLDNVEIFDIVEHKSNSILVEFKLNTYSTEVISLKDLK